MKKLSILILLLLTSLVSVYGQDEDKKNKISVEFGVKGGLNFTSPDGNIKSANKETKTAFHFGGFAEFKITDKFSIQPELIYSQQGNTVDLSDGTNNPLFSTFKINDEIQYLNLPIMAKYYFYKGFTLETGPQIGYMLSSKREFDTGSVISEDASDQTSNIDYAINFGLGYKFDNGIRIGARYNLGLNNSVKSPIIENQQFSYLKNNVVQFSLGYSF